MAYQSKTTMVQISVSSWTEKTDCSLSSRYDAARSAAMKIAIRCQMDIMSFIPYTTGGAQECYATVIYTNNGRSVDDIITLMEPEINNYPLKYWMIQDLYEWKETLDCVVMVRGTKEDWR